MSSLLSSVSGTAMSLTDKVLSPLNNSTVSLTLTVMLVLYSGLIAGNPPTSVVKLMEKPVARVICIFLLAVVLSKGDRKLAVMATVAVLITMISANRISMLADFVLGKSTGILSGVKDVVKKEVAELGTNA